MKQKSRGRIKSQSVWPGQKGKRWMFFSLLFFCFFSLTFICGTRAAASSASVTIQADKNRYAEGEDVYITVSLRSADAIKGFEGYFTYDSRYLRFEGGGSLVHGNDDAFRVLDMERARGSNSIKYVIKFTARKEGSTTIALKKPYNVLADDDKLSKMSVSHNALNLVVAKQDIVTPSKSPEEPKNEKGEQKPEDEIVTVTPGESSKPGKNKTKNNIPGSSQLRKLLVDGSELTPEFSPEITKYSGIVSLDGESIAITTKPQDSNADVKIKGNKNLKDGKNVVRVIVTGTGGEQTVYRISLTVQKVASIENSGSSQVRTVRKNGNTYVVGSAIIQAGEPEPDMIPDGFEEVETYIDGIMVVSYAWEGDNSQKYVLIYGKEEKIFYLYDKADNILLPYEKVRSWYQNKEENNINAENEVVLQSYRYILGILGAFSALMFIMMLFFALRRRKA